MTRPVQTEEEEQFPPNLADGLAGLDMVILLVGVDLRIRRFTPAAAKLLHLSPDFVGRLIADVRLGIDMPDVEELLATAVGHGIDLTREVRDENGRWHLLHVSPYRKATAQQVDGAVVCLVDIGELKRSQEALRREERLCAEIVDAARDLLVVIVDPEARITRFNAACQRITGYSLDEVAGKRVWDFLLVPDEAGAAKEIFKRSLAGERSIQSESSWVTKEGERRRLAWFHAPAVRKDGSVEYLIQTGIDLTPEREAVAQAQERGATVLALMESAAQAILAVTDQGRIALLNSACEKMFGYKRQELLGRPVEDLIPERSIQRHLVHRAEFFRAPKKRPMGIGLDLAGVRNGRVEFPIEVSLSHVETREGTLAVAFISDITERKHAEVSLRESENRLRTLSAGLLTAQEDERKRLSRELHDDLNQQVALLSLGMAELEAGLPDSGRYLKDRIVELQNKLAGLSEDLRRAAYQLHPAVLEHLGLVAALESHCEHLSRQVRIKLRFKHHDLPQHIPEAAAVCLFRVAQEGLRNVIRHSGASRASIELVGKENEIALTITDNGNGFDLAEARKRGGLGLVSMEERARLANGTVLIRARRGAGTRILFRFPSFG